MEADTGLVKDYSQNLIDGKKNLICGDYPEAVACFQVACELQSERFGDTAPECAEVFFYYGKALLELARQENSVLGNAIQAVPERDDSDSDDEPQASTNIPGVAKILREATDRFISTGNFGKPITPTAQKRLFDIQEETNGKKEALEAEENGNSKDSPGDIKEETNGKKEALEAEENGNSKDSPGGEPSSQTPGCSNIKGDSNIPGPSTSNSASTSSGEKAEDNDEENPDDIPNMQLAWEMLELAKVLYSKQQNSDEKALMVAQCCLKLGELGLEIENYSQSIEDFLECLSLYKSALTEHDRRMAEIHYSLGLAFNFDKQYEKCIDHYKAAHAVLEKRIEHLKKQGSSDGEAESNQSEIDEIKELIPDITSKIEDVLITRKQESRLAAFATSSGFKPGSSQSTSSVCNTIPVRKSTSSEKPASDISHLIRKKRSSDEVSSSKPTGDESPSKKMKKTENSTKNSADNSNKSSKISEELQEKIDEVQSTVS